MAFSGVQNGGIKVGTVYSYMQGVLRMYGSVVFGQTNIFVWGEGLDCANTRSRSVGYNNTYGQYFYFSASFFLDSHAQF